jgi:hypothetical protein
VARFRGGAAAERVILDPAEEATGRTEFDITDWISSEGVDWGDAEIRTYFSVLVAAGADVELEAIDDIRRQEASPAGERRAHGGVVAAVAVEREGPLERLMACAVPRQRFDEWPSQARMHAGILHNMAGILDEQEFEKLANHLQLRTRDTVGLSVGGRGVVEYSDVDHERLDENTLRLAEQWLDVEIRRDIDHICR